jgi:hypothetical protein
MGGLRDLRAPRPLVPRMQLCRAGLEGSKPARANRFSRDPDPSRSVLHDPFSATRSLRPVLRGSVSLDLSFAILREIPRSWLARRREVRVAGFCRSPTPGFTDVGLTRFSMSARAGLPPEACILAASALALLPRSRRKFPFHPGFSVPGNPIPKKSRPQDPAPAFPSGRLIPDPASGRFPPPKFHPSLCSPGKRPLLSGRVRGSPRRRNRLRRPPGACPHCAARSGWLAFRFGTLPERRLSPRVFWTYPDLAAT